jgi:hypothetical protein
MTPEQQYAAIKAAALKIGVEIREKNLHVPGIRVKSGLCRVKGRLLFILDRKKTIREKIALAAGCISEFDYRNSGLAGEIDRFAGIADD